MANRSIFPCDRLRLSLCRDRLDPALRAVSRSPRVCNPSRAVCVSFFRWPWQRLCTEINRATRRIAGIVGPPRANPLDRRRRALPLGCPRSAPRARARRRRHRRGCRPASRSRAVTVSLADAAARYPQDRGIVSTNRTASILHGPAISVGSRPRCRSSARTRALGVGHQRLCLRAERDPRLDHLGCR